MRSLLNFSIRTSQTPEAALKTLQGRLQALATAHDLLSESQWRGADLRLIIERELTPHHPGSDSVRLTGPTIGLSARATTAMAMTLHELATNAVAHGSLSVPEGQVNVLWEITNGFSGPRLILTWEEQRGPQVKTPRRTGFGSRLITGRIPYEVGGTSTLEFRPTGVFCRLELPLDRGFALPGVFSASDRWQGQYNV